MKLYQLVIDTNVLVAALRSKRGASHKLLLLLGSDKFRINVSVPLLFEYEDAVKRETQNLLLSPADVDDILDYICTAASKREIFFLWRPFLLDPKDDFILELAVEAQCDFIITYNRKDFKDIEKFGVDALTPKEFLQLIGELP